MYSFAAARTGAAVASDAMAPDAAAAEALTAVDAVVAEAVAKIVSADAVVVVDLTRAERPSPIAESHLLGQPARFALASYY